MELQSCHTDPSKQEVRVHAQGSWKAQTASQILFAINTHKYLIYINI